MSQRVHGFNHQEAALSKWKLKWEDDLSPNIFQKLICIKIFVFAFVLSSEKYDTRISCRIRKGCTGNSGALLHLSYEIAEGGASSETRSSIHYWSEDK